MENNISETNKQKKKQISKYDNALWNTNEIMSGFHLEIISNIINTDKLIHTRSQILSTSPYELQYCRKQSWGGPQGMKGGPQGMTSDSSNHISHPWSRCNL